MSALTAATLFALVLLSFAQPNCFSDPSDPSCASFEYPEDVAGENLDMLCMMMSNMVGCTLRRHCDSGAIPSMSPRCTPFSLLTDICRNDPGMAGMGGCSDYRNICGTNSTVEQCTTETGTTAVLSTADATASARQACTMHECSDCSQTSCPDPLKSLSDVCQIMPMSSCSGLQSMCAANSGNLGTLCSSALEASEAIPMMRMFFHYGFTEYVLFEDYVPQNESEYVGAWFFVFFMGVFSAYLKVVRARTRDSFTLGKDVACVNPQETVPSEELNPIHTSVDNNASDFCMKFPNRVNNTDSPFVHIMSILSIFPKKTLSFVQTTMITGLAAIILTLDYFL